MLTLLGLLIALIIAAIVYYVAGALGLPGPIPMIVALVVILLYLLRGFSGIAVS